MRVFSCEFCEIFNNIFFPPPDDCFCFVPQIGSKELNRPKLILVKPFGFVNYKMCHSRVLLKLATSDP